jgi:hypothetical protein
MQCPSRLLRKGRLAGLSLAFLLTGLAAAQPMLPRAEPSLTPGTFRLTVTEREISLDAQEASSAAIVADIGRRTGIPTVIYPGADERITIHMARVALDEALRRIATNVVILPAQGADAPPHRIAQVYVLAKGQPRPPEADSRPVLPQASRTTDATGHTTDATARSAPFQFIFDPSQPTQPSQ